MLNFVLFYFVQLGIQKASVETMGTHTANVNLGKNNIKPADIIYID